MFYHDTRNFWKQWYQWFLELEKTTTVSNIQRKFEKRYHDFNAGGLIGWPLDLNPCWWRPPRLAPATCLPSSWSPSRMPRRRGGRQWPWWGDTSRSWGNLSWAVLLSKRHRAGFKLDPIFVHGNIIVTLCWKYNLQYVKETDHYVARAKLYQSAGKTWVKIMKVFGKLSCFRVEIGNIGFSTWNWTNKRQYYQLWVPSVQTVQYSVSM